MRALLAAAFLLLAAPALANGRYPTAGQFAADPTDPQHFLVRTTYGFLQTVDGGASWQWLCELAVGYDGQEDPFVGILGNGAILAATTRGLAVSRDRACDWQMAPVPPQPVAQPAIDLVIDPHAPLHAIVLHTATDGQHHALSATQDGGQTWQPLGTALPQDAAGLTLELAPSRPTRVYVSARVGADHDQHAILRSDDGGATWLVLPFQPTMTDATGVPLPADQTQVLGTYIGAVDPLDPQVVWLRVRRSFNPDQLWRTQDGGTTWQLAFQAPKGKLVGFALSPDGKQVAVGATTPQPGLWRADTGTLQFAQVHGLSVSCLKWLESGLYACADEALDGMTIGVSTDSGATFTALHHRAELAPLTCPDASRTGQLCGALWPNVAYQLGVTSGAPTAVAKPGGCQAGRAGGAAALIPLAIALLWLVRRRVAA